MDHDAAPGPRSRADAVPPHAYFVVSAVFHYLGPAFAVLLFARVAPLGVAWLRIATAAAVFALWRKPWRAWRTLGRDGRRTVVAWAGVLAAMNSCFYLAIDRLPLGTVAAIEFAGPVALAAAGVRTRRNAVALALAAAGVYTLTGIRLTGEPVGVAFAFANAALFSLYVVLGHRAANHARVAGIDALGAAMLVAALVATPVGLWGGGAAVFAPVALAAGAGVGIASSVIPYVCDQLALARLPRATYALFVSLLPATATVVGLVVLRQVPTLRDLVGVGLVVAGVAVHRERRSLAAQRPDVAPGGSARMPSAQDSPTASLKISTDASRVDRDLVHRFLHDEAYWCKGIDRDTLDTALDNSLCFGAYEDGAQVGFARLVTDRATFAYLCDVFVVPERRGRGIGKLLVAAALDHPALRRLRRVMLATDDAHGLYETFGFEPLHGVERYMAIELTPAQAYGR